MSDKPVKAGIVGLGRWAKVLTKASKKSKLLEIVAGYSRSEEKRTAFQQELGVPAAASMQAMLADPEIQGRHPHGAQRAAPADGARGGEEREARVHGETYRQHA